MLHNLKHRFEEFHDYHTYCGYALVVINPYQEQQVYGPQTIEQYRGVKQEAAQPHVFAVAEDALVSMEIEQKSQSIIVSGESGAGKTQSARYIMRYLAHCCVAPGSGGGSGDIDGGGATKHHSASAAGDSVEQKVLATNPILEAFGNAKTLRNDNSSRFGKFIRINFAAQGHRISGARISTYLLEKSRVVSQAEGERNFHVFHYLASVAEDDPLAKRLKLGKALEISN